MIQFTVLTIFPEMFSAFKNESIIGRANQNGNILIDIIDIRDFSLNKHKKTDDYPYGGGSGMIMTPQPIFDAYKSIKKRKASVSTTCTVYMSPQGKLLDQDKVNKLSELDELIILCGHYEGVDERIIELLVDEEISIGDYVLTGGEIPAMVLMDAVSRKIPGVLSKEEAFINESLYDGLLEYPQYTRPDEFMGKTVPEVLLSGHHANIEKWRKEKSIERTRTKRPDLYKKWHKSCTEQE